MDEDEDVGGQGGRSGGGGRATVVVEGRKWGG